MPAHKATSDPARVLRTELQRMRTDGWTFGRAWHAALQTALATVPDTISRFSERGSWETVFTQTRSAWRDAYYAAENPAPWAPVLNDEEPGDRADVALVA